MTILLEEEDVAQAPASYSEAEVLAAVCRESFYEFVREFWGEVSAEKPVWNWHIEYLCDELQKVAERVFKGLPREYDLIINVPPGTTKSTIGSIMFPAWVWTRMPSARCICASYAYSLSMDLSRKSRDVVKSDKYRACFRNVILRDDQDSKGYYVNLSGGYRFAVGVDGAVMGMHAHFIIVDDPLDPKQALSDADIATANHWMEETLPSRKVDKALTPTILIMQRLHENDPTGNRMEKKSPYKKICLPAETTPDICPPELVMMYEDGLLDPVRLPRDVLDEQFELLQDYGYAGQYLQSPAPRGGAMFKIDQIVVEKYPPKRFKRVVRYWDKAGSIKKKSAFTAGVKMAITPDGQVWLLDVLRGRMHSAQREALIKKTARDDGRTVSVGVEQEPGSGGKESAENTVRNLHGFHVVVDKVSASTGDKEARAYPLSSQVNGGNFFMVKAEWNKAFLAEMRFFPASKYKDQIDAASGAYNMLGKGRIVVGGLSVLGRRD